MEKKTLAKVYIVDFACDKCGKNLEWSGEMVIAQPPKFLHECACGNVKVLEHKYPYHHVESAGLQMVRPMRGEELY